MAVNDRGAADARFEVRRTLGSGGMGIVYEVRDRQLDDIVALKVLDPQFGSVTEAVDRFKRELKIARRIHHPNVAQLYDLVLWRGRLAITQELILGRSLEAMLSQRHLAPQSVARQAHYLCSALYAAHQLGVVHQDLKPANIIVDSDGLPHVLDFGIARLAGTPSLDREDLVYGTPAYMSPEQAYEPSTVDARSDIYSLGVVLYRMATGRVPFEYGDPQELFAAHRSEMPAPPSSLVKDLPQSFDEVLLRCLEKRPSERYQTARDLSRALAGLWPEAVAPRLKTGTTVLVIDDDRLTRRMVGDALRRRGVGVIEAENGFRGVELALSDKPDLVLLDLIMPVLDGREALRILKSNPAVADVPVVVMTGLEDTREEAMLARDIGAVAFLNKPVQDDVLQILLEQYAGRVVSEAPVAIDPE